MWLFELRGGFRNVDIIIWRLIEILTSQGLVVTRNCELIIILNLLKVLEHLIIIRSWEIMRNLIALNLIMSSLDPLTQWSYMRICSLYSFLLKIYLSKLLVARYPCNLLQPIRLLKVILLLLKMQWGALPLSIGLDYFDLDIRFHKSLRLHELAKCLTKIYLLATRLHNCTYILLASVGQQLPYFNVLLVQIAVIYDFCVEPCSGLASRTLTSPWVFISRVCLYRQ